MPETSVDLPPELYEELRHQLDSTEFTTVGEYVTFVLREVLAELETERTVATNLNEPEVKDRLRSLGYID